MGRKIVSASVSVQDGLPALKIRPSQGNNILSGENAEEVLWALAGIFGTTPRQISAQLKAEVCWPGGVSFWVSGEILSGESVIFVQHLYADGREDDWVKAFHKQRFLEHGNVANIFDGTSLRQRGCMGESDLILENFLTFLRRSPDDDRPLFICNLLERLDESIDLRPIFSALAATGRQVFIAVSRSYQIIALEEMPYDTTICPL